MSDDYTPGHALDDIGDVIGARLAATWSTELSRIVTRLYKAGQANERAAMINAFRLYARRSNQIGWRFMLDAIKSYERGDLS